MDETNKTPAQDANETQPEEQTSEGNTGNTEPNPETTPQTDTKKSD